MGVVGEFPLGKRNIAVRMPVNPLDKATVVSIYPWDIEEIKPTMQPGKFYIPKGSYSNPSVLILGPSSWWRDVDEGDNSIEIPTSAILMADSIVRDYCLGTIEVQFGIAQPGLFYIAGAKKSFDIIKEHKDLLDNALAMQTRWYEALIKLGDSLWARSRGNPLAIDDRMRTAARELKRDKPWIADFQMVELIPCVACGNLRNPAFPVCHHCNRVVDAALAKTLGIPI